METEYSGNYLSNREWFRNALKGQNVILCYTSALECHELFLGYVNEKQIDVYALEKGECFLQVLFTESCKSFFHNVASGKYRTLQVTFKAF